ncbi:hypothetical protein DPMN_182126 [Dreissena polymorpha]|uniref:Uncharacterized protein n=1 Tax=Dreissena polymorpha TaxID=45954 RepID=A0A9D4DGJ5_DREPO|nr:hypothetical protein DPMN_182126 [Dreissena polymorpha]
MLSEWLCSLLITPSSLDHLVEFELLNVVLQSSGDTLDNESHTHVSDLRSKILSRDMSNIEVMVKNGCKEFFELLRGTIIGSLKVIISDPC